MMIMMNLVYIVDTKADDGRTDRTTMASAAVAFFCVTTGVATAAAAAQRGRVHLTSAIIYPVPFVRIHPTSLAQMIDTKLLVLLCWSSVCRTDCRENQMQGS